MLESMMGYTKGQLEFHIKSSNSLQIGIMINPQNLGLKTYEGKNVSTVVAFKSKVCQEDHRKPCTRIS